MNLWLTQGHAHNLQRATATRGIPQKVMPIVKGIHENKRKKGKEMQLRTTKKI